MARTRQRQANFNDIGQEGRFTGIKVPNIPPSRPSGPPPPDGISSTPNGLSKQSHAADGMEDSVDRRAAHFMDQIEDPDIFMMSPGEEQDEAIRRRREEMGLTDPKGGTANAKGKGKGKDKEVNMSGKAGSPTKERAATKGSSQANKVNGIVDKLESQEKEKEPPRSAKKKGGRSQNFNDIGVEGRQTGIRIPPGTIRRNSNGLENVSDFFDSPNAINPPPEPGANTRKDKRSAATGTKGKDKGKATGVKDKRRDTIATEEEEEEDVVEVFENGIQAAEGEEEYENESGKISVEVVGEATPRHSNPNMRSRQAPASARSRPTKATNKQTLSLPRAHRGSISSDEDIPRTANGERSSSKNKIPVRGPRPPPSPGTDYEEPPRLSQKQKQNGKASQSLTQKSSKGKGKNREPSPIDDSADYDDAALQHSIDQDQVQVFDTTPQDLEDLSTNRDQTLTMTQNEVAAETTELGKKHGRSSETSVDSLEAGPSAGVGVRRRSGRLSASSDGTAEKESPPKRKVAGNSKKGKSQSQPVTNEDAQGDGGGDGFGIGMGSGEDVDFDVDGSFARKELSPVAEEGEEEPGEESDEEVRVAANMRGQKGKEKQKVEATKPARGKKRTFEEASVEPGGVRRSSRRRMEPLDFWRGEHVSYKRRQSGGIGIKEIVKVDKLPEDQLRAKKKPKKVHKKPVKREDGEGWEVQPTVIQPEEGWDDRTSPDINCWDYEHDYETIRRIAFTKKMVEFKPPGSATFQFQKVFNEMDYLAAGILLLHVGGEKPIKPAKDNSYVFICLEGAVEVMLHRTKFTIGPMGMFLVPRGNIYGIKNIANRESRLFFSQSRRTLDEPDEPDEPK